MLEGSFFVSVALAAALAGAVGLLLRRESSSWLHLLLLVIIVAIPLANPSWRILSYHGLIHAGIIYEIFERGFPPENPLLGGEPLHYGWAHHLLLATVMRAVPLAPPELFVATNLVSLVVIWMLLDRAARVLSAAPSYRVLACLLALLGSNPFGLWAKDILEALGIRDESRWLPIHKFALPESNQLGYVFFALVLLGALRLREETPRIPAGIWMIAGGLLGAAVFYPVVWPGAAAVAALAVFLLFLVRTAPARRTARTLAVVLVATSCLAVPWIHWLNAGRDPSGQLQPLADLPVLGWHLQILLVMWVLPASILVAGRGAIAAALARTPYEVALLAFGSLGLQAMYFLIQFGGAEYKFLGLGQLPLGLLLGLALQSVLERRRSLALAMLAAAALPFAFFSAPKMIWGWPGSDALTSKGRFLEHVDPARQATFGWLADNTDERALVLDTHLTIPSLARRQLFVGVDLRRDRGEIEGQRDGFSATMANTSRMIFADDAQTVRRRRALAESVLDVESLDIGPEVVRGLREEARGRPLYVVARGPELADALERSAAFARAHDGGDVTVYRLVEAR